MKTETLEEFINSQPYYGTCTTEYLEGIEVGANWQFEQLSKDGAIQNLEKGLDLVNKIMEQMYCVEEVIEFSKWKDNNTVRVDLDGYKLFGDSMDSKLYALKELLEIFKNK